MFCFKGYFYEYHYLSMIYIRVVEKEDYINTYIIILIIIINSLYQSGWKGGSPAAGNTFVARRELGPHNQHRFLHRSLGVFVLLYSLYLHFWVLCIRISVTIFLDFKRWNLIAARDPWSENYRGTLHCNSREDPDLPFSECIFTPLD